MKSFRFSLAGATWSGRLIACLSATLAMVVTSTFSAMVLDETSPLLLGPIAASAVLIFTLPTSPLSQPWRVIGGHVISAVIGYGAAILIPDTALAAELSLGLSMLVMTLTRSFHPPGGGMAVTTALAGPEVAKWGILFPFLPVGLNAIALVLTGVAFHALFRQSYPHHPSQEPAGAPAATSGVLPEDLDRALEQMGATFDISREDLNRLLDHAEANAIERRRGPTARMG
ncbi:hypothetical protein GCM10007276_00700 [Agaricicola taiwanensis]|uniref:HPP transmembrane region domain-containing protein n=1 Tax=Agaricicola taiwanensis TaxID=591372 RepID=A0A8J2YBA0_9RHOB|nr:HPP family protein [Agaricicola taiwanensis]GGE27355.1 hypothetical protein GCM10007276_00700 [Agaricicola taiwanensis]